ncbi:hypothetical protein [Terrabacter sp. Root181]|uniref:hypothetical protein n=1 Tax=Terrabacter sp. Root181 TaxID=1736484 RepID=UPI0006F9989A|nr:hypothetical protein [Terrabacter sp. Root181]KRB47970.1 hypothetical protein ASD90_06650 [Terrabacter sp. Root181]
MQPRRSRPYAAGRALVTGVAAALALAACGTAAAPQPGETSLATGPVRAVTDQPVEADGALRCPESVGSVDLSKPAAVPQKPQGIDGAARLLPDRDPASVVVCGYPVVDIMATTPLSPPFRLAKRSVASESQRAALVEAMTWAPRVTGGPGVCTLMAGNETAYLVGAAYGDAIVWVSALADANACSTSTNGDFPSGPGPAVVLDQMFGTRTPPPEAVAACSRSSWGRLGDDQTLAPTGDPTVTVCRDLVDGTVRATQLDAAPSAQVTAALRALPTKPTDQTCQGSDKTSDARFALVLAYAVGPAVRINVDPACTPSVLGSGLESQDAGSLVDLVEQWSPPIPAPDPNGSVSSDGSVAPPATAPDATVPTEVPGSTGGGAGGTTGIEPATPTEIPMTK